MTRRNLALPILILSGLAVLLHGGCSITFNPTPNGGTEGKVTIRVVNNTSVDLDPQIFIAASVLPRNELFQQKYKYTDYGVFDEGLLGPYGSETFTLDCADARAVGTLGGKFNENGTVEKGDREYILTQENVYFCGDVITFTYSRTSDGYTVNYDLN